MARFDIGDKIYIHNLEDYYIVKDVDEVTRPLPQYKLEDEWGEFWSYCFEYKKIFDAEDVLRYGDILTDENFRVHNIPIDNYVRIRTIRYESHIFYHKMVNGEVVEFKELTV